MRNSGMGRHCESLGWEDTSLPLSRAIVWTHLFSSFYPGKQPAYQEHPPAATRSGRSLATPFARPQGHAARGTCGLQCVRGMCPHDRRASGTGKGGESGIRQGRALHDEWNMQYIYRVRRMCYFLKPVRGRSDKK